MFNLEDFKKYGKAVRRDGKIVRFIAHVPDAALDQERLICMDDARRLFPCCEDGMTSSRGLENNFDLVDVVRPMLNVSFSVPEPLSEEPEPGDTVYAIYGSTLDPSAVQVIWGAQSSEFNRMNMKRGFVWKTLEEAQAAANILKKGFRQ